MHSTKRLWAPEGRARNHRKLGPNTIQAITRHGCSIPTAMISRSFIKANGRAELSPAYPAAHELWRICCGKLDFSHISILAGIPAVGRSSDVEREDHNRGTFTTTSQIPSQR